MSRKNPFPGMNPWLEHKWSDVHFSLISFIRQDLGANLPDGLVARAEEHVGVSDSDELRKYRSDVSIRTHAESTESWSDGQPPLWAEESNGGNGLKVSVPKLVSSAEPVRRWIEISDDNGKLITVIEVLSPANKEGREASRYRAKCSDYLAAGVSVVEIDLLRRGEHVVQAPIDSLDDSEANPYLVSVTRGHRIWQNELYQSGLRESLPVIAIPLRPQDSDVALDVQSLVDRTYETGRYWTLDYSRKLSPKLSEADLAWAMEQVKGVE